MGKVILGSMAILAVALGTAGSAQTLRDSLREGLSKAKEGAEAVGQGAAGVAESIGNSVDSTVDLMSDEATAEETRIKLDTMVGATLARLFEEQPEARALFEVSAGHAVFDTRKLTIAGFSGGAGRGVAVSRDGERTYMNMGTAGLGLSLGIGGFETQVVILFEDERDFDDFVTYGYDATADAGTMFGDDTETLGVRFVDGRALFTLTKRGWKVSASAGGTKYWADPELN